MTHITCLSKQNTSTSRIYQISRIKIRFKHYTRYKLHLLTFQYINSDDFFYLVELITKIKHY